MHRNRTSRVGDRLVDGRHLLSPFLPPIAGGSGQSSSRGDVTRVRQLGRRPRPDSAHAASPARLRLSTGPRLASAPFAQLAGPPRIPGTVAQARSHTGLRYLAPQRVASPIRNCGSQVSDAVEVGEHAFSCLCEAWPAGPALRNRLARLAMRGDRPDYPFPLFRALWVGLPTVWPGGVREARQASPACRARRVRSARRRQPVLSRIRSRCERTVRMLMYS